MPHQLETNTYQATTEQIPYLFSRQIVLLQGDNDGCSVVVVFRHKAQPAAKGGSLCQGCNAVAGHHSSALRIGVSAPMDGVAPLGKGVTIPGEARLAMTADTPTASVIITLKEY